MTLQSKCPYPNPSLRAEGFVLGRSKEERKELGPSLSESGRRKGEKGE